MSTNLEVKYNVVNPYWYYASDQIEATIAPKDYKAYKITIQSEQSFELTDIYLYSSLLDDTLNYPHSIGMLTIDDYPMYLETLTFQNIDRTKSFLLLEAISSINGDLGLKKSYLFAYKKSISFVIKIDNTTTLFRDIQFKIWLRGRFNTAQQIKVKIEEIR